jgi:hypothetical protein
MGMLTYLGCQVDYGRLGKQRSVPSFQDISVARIASFHSIGTEEVVIPFSFAWFEPPDPWWFPRTLFVCNRRKQQASQGPDAVRAERQIMRCQKVCYIHSNVQ